MHQRSTIELKVFSVLVYPLSSIVKIYNRIERLVYLGLGDSSGSQLQRSTIELKAPRNPKLHSINPKHKRSTIELKDIYITGEEGRKPFIAKDLQ